MAFLRGIHTGKFFRFISAGKNLFNLREYEVAAPQPGPICVCAARNFSSLNASIPSQTLENSLKRLDQDVRRSGRISRRDLEEILDEIRISKSATSSQSLLVIRCCGSLVPEELPEVRTKMVQEIWKTLSRLEVPMDISHYNALLRVYLENEYSFSPTEFLTDLLAKGLEPNRVTYQRLISRYCQEGDIDGASQILDHMRDKQFTITEGVFNALVMGHSNADDLTSAASILPMMTQSGLEPSAETYTTLICGYARKGDMESINKYIALCEGKEIQLLDKDFLEIVYALAVNGHGDKVDAVLLKIRKSFGYNQDAVNVILRLINRGQEQIGLKILKTMTRARGETGESNDTGNFLIRQLVKANRPVDQLMQICHQLQETNMNSKPTLIALEASMKHQNSEVTKVLLAELQLQGIEVRQHYFWPLFCAAKTEKEVIEISELMMNVFKMTPTNETVRNYMIPKLLKDDDYDAVIRSLTTMGITLGTASSTTAFVALRKNNLKKAAEIAGSFEAYLSPGLYKQELFSALSATKDYESFVMFLRQIIENIGRAKILNQARLEAEEEDAEGVIAVEDASAAPQRTLKELKAAVLGDLVMEAVMYFKQNRIEIVTKILTLLVDEGLSIGSSKAERIQDRLAETMTEEISTLLGKLTSGELEPVPIERQKMQTGFNRQFDVVGLERAIARAEDKGENRKELKRLLLVAAIRAKDIAKTEEILERLKAEGFTFSAGVYAQLVELYASADKVEEALHAHKQIRVIDPEFSLDETKTIKLAQALANADRIDEAVKFLEDNKPKETVDEKWFNHQNTCWRFLNMLAEKGATADLTRIFDVMVANGYFTPGNVMLGPLIKVHLVKDELKEAVAKFEELSQKYRATPWKNEIACRLIQAEDAASLQRITDLSTEIHGEVNSLYDLVFSFIECGRVRQARKILETPGLKTRPQRINFACERYVSEGMPTALEGLIEATKDLNHIDRTEIYNSLLQTYIKNKDPEKALNLWTAMQEEDDINPSDAFLSSLANFLKSEGRPVPFNWQETSKPSAAADMKEPALEVAAKAAAKRQTKRANPLFTPTVAAFKDAIKSGDVDAIVKAKEQLLPSDKVPLMMRSESIEAMVRKDELHQATKQVFEMLDAKTHPAPRIFRFYLNRVAASGDTETIEKIGKVLSTEQKKVVSFDNRVCHSFIVSGKTDEYLKQLEDRIENAKNDEELASAADEFPRGGAIGIMENNPQYVERFHKIAAKYAEKKVTGPINVLWMHYLIQNDSQADQIFKDHLADSPRLMFQRVMHTAREKGDEDLIHKLIAALQGTKVSEGAFGNVYSCLLDINASKNDADACLKTTAACLKDTCLENVNRTALLRAKECVEKAGHKFPHTIPEKKPTNQDSSSSSSSSSSDDEVTRKKQ